MKEYELYSAKITELYKLSGKEFDNLSNYKSFNIIEAAVRTGLRETVHSRILANLLRYDKKILKSFLEKFSLGDIANQEWELFVEKNNMDVVMEADHDVLIIENKVNGACEQPDQIDRYVQHYLGGSKNRKIHVLYLNRTSICPPSEYSWSKHKDKCDLTVCSYEKHIRPWIDDVISKNKDIAIALGQYKEYLDIMFDKNVKNMEANIKDEVKRLLQLNTEAGHEQEVIVKLDKAIETFEILLSVCQSMKWETKWKEIQLEINSFLRGKDLPDLKNQDEMRWDLPDAGIAFKLSGDDTQFYAVISYLQKRYVGIINTNKPKENNIKLDQIFKEMFRRIGDGYSTPRYPIWFYCDNDEELIKKYEQMVNILIENSKGNDSKVVGLRK